MGDDSEQSDGMTLPEWLALPGNSVTMLHFETGLAYSTLYRARRHGKIDTSTATSIHNSTAQQVSLAWLCSGKSEPRKPPKSEEDTQAPEDT